MYLKLCGESFGGDGQCIYDANNCLKKVHVKEYASTCMKSLWNCTCRQQKPLDEARGTGRQGDALFTLYPSVLF